MHSDSSQYSIASCTLSNCSGLSSLISSFPSLYVTKATYTLDNVVTSISSVSFLFPALSSVSTINLYVVSGSKLFIVILFSYSFSFISSIFCFSSLFSPFTSYIFISFIPEYIPFSSSVSSDVIFKLTLFLVILPSSTSPSILGDSLSIFLISFSTSSPRILSFFNLAYTFLFYPTLKLSVYV